VYEDEVTNTRYDVIYDPTPQTHKKHRGKEREREKEIAAERRISWGKGGGFASRKSKRENGST
jgi:hypothetical protein